MPFAEHLCYTLRRSNKRYNPLYLLNVELVCILVCAVEQHCF